MDVSLANDGVEIDEVETRLANDGIAIDENLTGGVCPICKDRPAKKEICTRCKQKACVQCIFNWMNFKKFDCPVCRGPLSPTIVAEYHA